MMKCSVCLSHLSHTDSTCKLSCFHELCTRCTIQWMKRKNTCPICRRRILWLKVVGTSPEVESVKVDSTRPLGLTLKNNFPGSLITSLRTQSCLRDVGLSRGDVILMINGLPAYHHEYTMDMLSELPRGEHVLVVIRRNPPLAIGVPPWSCWPRRNWGRVLDVASSHQRNAVWWGNDSSYECRTRYWRSVTCARVVCGHALDFLSWS